MTVLSKSTRRQQEEERSEGDGGQIERKSEVNTRVVSREYNELIREFKMAAGDGLSMWGRL